MYDEPETAERMHRAGTESYVLKTAVDEVECRSGLDFLPLLPDAEEDAMEATEDLAWAQRWVN